VPTRAMFRGDMTVARGYWHWLFHLQPDLPELLVGDRVEEYLRWFIERWTVDRAAVDEAVEHYVTAYRRPGALRAGFDDYRATFPDDIAHDDADAERGNRLRAPLLVLWGEGGLPAGLPVVGIWKEYADDVRGEVVPACGHFVPEERPDLLVEHLLGFLGGGVSSERRPSSGLVPGAG
jgi:haloacetate dehalogenase